VDANAYDNTLQLAFGASADGTVTIAHEATAEEFRVVQTVQTQPGARTLALDPSTHRIYLATSDSSAPAQVVPGSFRILVFGPGAH